MHPWHDLPPGPQPPTVLNCIVEIPGGSRNKYELEKDSGLFRFDRLLYSSVHYPGDYGFVPQTLADDGDPLDVLVLVTEPTFTGCLIRVRPIGVFEMTDQEELDEKLLAVPLRDPLFSEYAGLGDVAPHLLREVEHFFAVYKELEGARTVSLGWNDRERADAIIQAALSRYTAARSQRQHEEGKRNAAG
ncbi:MAG: inorganic diphosphatase [Longimicrobiales bacterium]